MRTRRSLLVVLLAALFGSALLLRANAAMLAVPAEAEGAGKAGAVASCVASDVSAGGFMRFGQACRSYANPILGNTADPGVLAWQGKYYMVATSGCPCFDIFVSDDLINWERTGASVFDGTHPWGTHSFWAPELHRLGNGRFAVYYSAYNPSADRLQVGVATADTVTGPYTDIGFPLVRENYGVIDVNFFRDDDGRQYLYWKEDGGETRIFGQEIDQAGTTFIGQPRTVLQKGLAWEGDKGIEAPWVTKRDGQYYMFYSGELFSTDKYAIGVARAASPLAAYAKKGDPILRSGNRWKGPGHNSTVSTSNNDYIVYHAWDRAAGVGSRTSLIDRIVWSGGWPTVPGGVPSEAAQPYPL